MRCRNLQIEGGKCLSNEYIDSNAKLEWECADGHRWWQTPHAIKVSGHWCPHCNFQIIEENIRYAFERLTGKKFPKKRPTWLKNNLGKRLELDGYCDELKCAFEYHGKQHFERSEFFQRSDDAFIMQQMNDMQKVRLCNENKITLLIFTYDENLFDIKSP